MIPCFAAGHGYRACDRSKKGDNPGLKRVSPKQLSAYIRNFSRHTFDITTDVLVDFEGVWEVRVGVWGGVMWECNRLSV